MNTKVDKQIKNYLRKISYKVIKSKINKSIHYKAYIGDFEIKIRFSDHFSSCKDDNIDIIKITDTIYTIRYNDCSTTITINDVLNYIKSLVLIYPDIKKILDDKLNLYKQVMKLQKNTVVSELKNVKDAYENLKTIHSNLKQALLEERQKRQSATDKVKGLTNKINLLEQKLSSIHKIIL